MTMYPRPGPDDVRRTLAHHAERTNARKDLTPAQKQREIAKLYVGASDVMKQLEQEHADTIKNNERAAHQRMFGPDGVAKGAGTSARLAAQRELRQASQDLQGVDRFELRQRLAQAEQTGDEVMARAIAQRALNLADHDLVSEYVSERPHLADTWAEMTAPQPRDPTDMFKWVVPKPPGLGNHDVESARYLATRRDDDGGSAA